jgi:DNA topoisomerase-3
MTARWETELDAISQKKGSYNAFMQPLLVSLHELIAQSQVALPAGLKDIPAKTAAPQKRRSGKAPRKAPRKAPKKPGATRTRQRKSGPRAPG